MKNWKTTSSGISMIVGALVGIYFTYTEGTVDAVVITTAVTAILGGIGLLFSKDYTE
jgi:uncharacterized membrane protein